MKEAALWYAAHGFSVFPLYEPVVGVPSQYVDDATRTKPFKWACSCPRGAMCGHVGKHPRTANGLHAATTDAQQISDWWDANPLANIGIRTGPGSNLLVVDSDPRNGGPDSLAGIGEALGHALPDTAAVRTGSGGIHAYYRSTGDKCAKNVPGTGIDFKRGGGYVVAPPSLHGCGERYEWDGMSDREALVNGELADAPAWLEAKARPTIDMKLHAAPEQGEKWPAGERNNRMTSLAGSLRRKGLPEAVILAALQAANKVHCDGALPDHEVRHIAGSVARYEPGEPAGGATGDWPDSPLPIGGYDPPDVELSMFPPGWFKNMVEAMAAYSQGPVGLPAWIALGIVSASVAGKVFIMGTGKYKESTNLYLLAAMPSGSRKSEVMRWLRHPMDEYQGRQCEAMQPIVDDIGSQRKMAEHDIAVTERNTKLSYSDRAARIREIRRQMPPPLYLPRMTCQDITPEKLVEFLYEHSERAVIISDEADALSTVTGMRYGGAPNLGALLMGHSLSEIEVDRKTRDADGRQASIVLHRPCVTVVLSPQPEPVFELNEKPGFRTLGLMARFLTLFPPESDDDESVSVDPPDDVVAAWDSAIAELLKLAADKDDEPIHLTLSPEARSLWQDFMKEQKRASKREQADLRDWTAKLAGHSLRIAALFHCCLHLGQTKQQPEVKAVTMQAAIAICRALVPHAFKAMAINKLTPQMKLARRMALWLVTEYRGQQIISRDCQRKYTRSSAEIAEAMAVLEDCGYVRPVSGAGRKDRAAWAVHPNLTPEQLSGMSEGLGQATDTA